MKGLRHTPILAILLLGPFAPLLAQQTPDTTYRHPLKHQAYAAGKGPMIFIDQAHHNFHTLEGGFMAFSRLMEQDGYRVGASTTALDQPGALADCKVLVIANPLHGSNDGNWTLPTPSAFTQAEIDSIRLWVQEGGSLLLIADHMPFAGAASDLAQVFGFQMLNGFAYTRQNTWPPSVFRRLDASLPDSPLLRGFYPDEQIDSVATFTGSAFRAPSGAIEVLRFLPGHYSLNPDTAWVFNDQTPRTDLDGYTQGALLEFGKGRIAVFGEAAMFTAQLANGNFPAGFNSPVAPGNAQFAINLMHWLDHRTGVPGLVSENYYQELLTRPTALEGYRSNQRGPLTKINPDGTESTDSTFSVEQMKISSDEVLINGWLYLPLGKGPFPLVVLTNGGGDGSRPIKSLSDWMAPILAHCGYAAFVHDKRGTGESGGSFIESDYEDFIRDAGQCAKVLSHDPRIDPKRIGIMGGSEGGLIAVAAACRYPEISFVISYAGTIVDGISDRLNAQLNGMVDGGVLNDSLLQIVKPLWVRSFEAWASNDPEVHKALDREIDALREVHGRQILPFKKSEMDSLPGFGVILPTWNSMGYDYLTELKSFKKPWLAMFGEIDRVVPTDASVKNLQQFMQESKNQNCHILIIPRCGHAPVDVDSRRMVRIDYICLNWLH